MDAAHAATLTIKSATAACPVMKSGDKVYITGNYQVNFPKSLTITEP